MKCGHCKTYDVSIEHVRNCTSTPGHLDRQPAPRPAISLPSLDVAPEVGIYVSNDGHNTYKVQQSPTTGRFYAKEWSNVTADFTYVGKAPLYRLTAANKITPEQAAKFGHLFGVCVFCSRTLTDERSIAVGYGPVCAEHNGLPWGESEEHACDFPKAECLLPWNDEDHDVLGDVMEAKALAEAAERSDNEHECPECPPKSHGGVCRRLALYGA